MDRFERILYLVGDRPATAHGFARATELARANDARLTVAHVLPPVPEGLDASVGLDLGAVLDRIAEERRRELDRLAGRAAEQGVEVAVRMLDGTTFLEAIREVLRAGHDLVVKDAEEAGGLEARLFGSTDQHLLRKCPVPVWLLDPEPRPRSGIVLAAVDVARAEPEPLARQIVRLAGALAAREGAALHVVHAWSLFGESYLRTPSFTLSERRLGELLDEAREERSRRLDRLVREAAPDVDATLELVKGEPARVIEAATRRIRPDVLVMGTLSRAGVAGFLIGNTAESVLGRVRCSVLTLKPEGFVSPVRLPPGREAPAAPIGGADAA